jgi:hypothetical protein
MDTEGPGPCWLWGGAPMSVRLFPYRNFFVHFKIYGTMDNSIEIVIISGMTAVLVVILEKIIEIVIIRIQSKTRLKEEIDINYLKQGLGLHTEMITLTYKSRNSVRSLLRTTESMQAFIDLKRCNQQFTENLYTYIMFIPKDLFKRLHVYKHLLQDSVMLVDAITSLEYKKLASSDPLKQMTQDQLQKKYDEMDKIYLSLIDDMKKIARTIDVT